MPVQDPHAALQNDPLKPFFKHKSPHFVVEMDRGIFIVALNQHIEGKQTLLLSLFELYYVEADLWSSLEFYITSTVLAQLKNQCQEAKQIGQL